MLEIKYVYRSIHANGVDISIPLRVYIYVYNIHIRVCVLPPCYLDRLIRGEDSTHVFQSLTGPTTSSQGRSATWHSMSAGRDSLTCFDDVDP